MQIAACNFLSQIVLPCLELFRDIREMVRRTRAEVWENECLEWKEKFRTAELEIQTLQEKLATAHAAMAVLAATVVRSMILPKRIAFPLDLLALGIVFGNPLLRLVSSLWQDANNVKRQVPPAVERLVEQIRCEVRSWNLKWKSVTTSSSLLKNAS